MNAGHLTRPQQAALDIVEREGILHCYNGVTITTAQARKPTRTGTHSRTHATGAPSAGNQSRPATCSATTATSPRGTLSDQQEHQIRRPGIMIFSDQACVVLGWDGSEHGWHDPWSEEADDEAKAIGGYVIQANSEPENIFADFRCPVIASISYDGISYHEVTGWDIGPDGDSGNRRVSDGDETTYSVPLDRIRTDHSRCAAEAHDRSLPDDGGRPYGQVYDENGFLSDKQAMAADGLLGCNDCGKPLFYCRIAEWYFHVDPEGGCWMHEAWGLSS